MIVLIGVGLFVVCAGFIAWGLAKAAAKEPPVPTVNTQKESEK